MRKHLPFLLAVLLFGALAIGQTSFLGNILQLHRQAEPLPTASSYPGAIVYNNTASTVYFSDGTTWAALGGSGDTLWVDAGAGAIKGVNDPQVQVGTSGRLFSAIAIPTNGATIDYGTGTYDYLESNGTRVQQGGMFGGGMNVTNLRVGGAVTLDATPSVANTGTGVLGFDQHEDMHYKLTTSKGYAPLLSGPDWAIDGRVWNIEVAHEVTACPIIRNNLQIAGASGGDTTVFCNDSAAATVANGATFPNPAYRRFVTTAVSGQRSIFGSFTTSAPASGVAQNTQRFTERLAGPVPEFSLLVGPNWATGNLVWYGGLTSAVPASGSLAANSIYVRYDSAASSQFQFCTCNAGTCTCSNTNVSPTNNGEYRFMIQGRSFDGIMYLFINGVYATNNTTNLPASSTPLGFVFAVENSDANARSAGLGRVSIRME